MATLACLFCATPVRGPREHVLATWFLKRYGASGPFTIMIDGKPVPTSGGRTQRDQLSRVMLPVCGHTSRMDCDGWLNTARTAS